MKRLLLVVVLFALAACAPSPEQIAIQTATAATATASAWTPTPRPTDTPTLTPTLTPAPTRTPTITPQPSPTPLSIITFKYDDGVASGERGIFEKGMELAKQLVGDAGPINVHAYANLETLIAEYAKSRNITPTSTGAQSFRRLYESGFAAATSDLGFIWVWVQDSWRARTAESRYRTIVHEYSHIMQNWLSGIPAARTGPTWLVEGVVDFATYRAVASIGLVDLDQVRAEKIQRTRGILSPLQAIDTPAAAEIIDSLAPYALGFLASEFLVSKLGTEKFFREYYSAIKTEGRWERAFEKISGMTVEAFYSQFEEYRREKFPPFCGNVGDKPESGEFAIKLNRQLFPGAMSIDGSPGTMAPNVPYVFCVSGFNMQSLTSAQRTAASKLPGRDWSTWTSCGGNCIVLYMKASSAPNTFKFGVQLPDGRLTEASFQHTIPK